MFSWITSLGFILMSLSISSLAGGDTDAQLETPNTDTSTPVAVGGAVASETENAVRIYIDPKTGEITEPPADVAGQMATDERLQTSQTVEEPIETFALPSGGVGIVVGDRFSKPVNIRVGCDGKMIEQGHDVDVSKAENIDCN